MSKAGIGTVRLLQNIDNLQILLPRSDFIVNQAITIRQPTLREIIDYGEQNYNALVATFTAHPNDAKSILWDIGIDYTKITSFELFCLTVMTLPVEKTRLLFGELDFSKLTLRKNNGVDALCDIRQNNVVIDEAVHTIIQDFICRSNLIKKKKENPGNESTKMMLIEWDRDDRRAAMRKPHRSNLLPYISAMVNSPGFKYDYSTVQNLTMYQFMDAVNRTSMIISSQSLLQGMYSNPYLDSTKIDKTQLNWLREASEN